MHLFCLCQDIFQKLQIWKLIISVFTFSSTPELLFGLYLLYYFRVFERQIGSNKYSVSAYWGSSFFLDKLLGQYYLQLPKLANGKIIKAAGVESTTRQIIKATVDTVFIVFSTCFFFFSFTLCSLCFYLLFCRFSCCSLLYSLYCSRFFLYNLLKVLVISNHQIWIDRKCLEFLTGLFILTLI